MTTTLLEKPAVHRLKVASRPNRVDRENGIIYGVVLAEVGPFESEGRGEFTHESLKEISALMDELPKGLKARWTHPLGSDDGLGKFLGRWKNHEIRGQKLRADLHFADVAKKPTPTSNGVSYETYIMDLAETDSTAFECSLAPGKVRQEYRLEKDGTRKRDPDGNVLPPIWHVESLTACDVVDEGDAVHGGFLSLEGISSRNTSEYVAQASRALDSLFENQPCDVIRSRVTDYLSRYLSDRFGDQTMSEPTKAPVTELKESGPSQDDLQRMVNDSVANALKLLNDKIDAIGKSINDSAAADAENRRAEKITALCKQANCPDKAADFIANKDLSADQVGTQLLEELVQDRSLTNGDGDGDKLTGKAKFEREYEENKNVLKSIVSKEDYVKDRLRESGELSETNPLVAGA